MALRKLIKPLFFLSAALAFWLNAGSLAAEQAPDHVVVVIMENHSYAQIIGSVECPYINSVLAANSALFTNSHAVEHPSQPNYLDLFSGSNQGVTSDALPTGVPFSTPNLGANLIAAGFTFATYSESLPSVGFDGLSFSNDPGKEEYVRKHNPAVNWQAADAPANHHLPSSANQPFRAFPITAAGFDALPTVSFVVPNEQNDMHDGSIATADNWLSQHLESYRSWAMVHNSLLILTFDEDNSATTDNHIVTIVAGQHVKAGQYAEAAIEHSPGAGIDHFNLLRTIESFYGLASCNSQGDGARAPVTDVFQPISNSFLLNCSTRLRTAAGENVMIGGFIIAGSTPQSLVLRAIGPSLNMAGALTDPALELHRSDGSVIAANDNWQATQESEIRATGLARLDTRESALLLSLAPGSYTALVSGNNLEAGVALMEIYALQSTSASRLVNMSTRGRVETGDNVMIAGFIIGGPDSSRTMVRALGPSLHDPPASLSGVLADPVLELHGADGDLIATNDNWQDSQQVEIENTTLAPSAPTESVIVGTYAPGSYTAIVRGKNDTSGIALVELYKLD